MDENGLLQQVCRDFYTNCIQVTPSRIQSTLKSATINLSRQENRGKSKSKIGLVRLIS